VVPDRAPELSYRASLSIGIGIKKYLDIYSHNRINIPVFFQAAVFMPGSMED
jgi:hypothetical protein